MLASSRASAISPHREAKGKGRDRKQRRAREDLSQHFGELPVGDRDRSDGVHRAAQLPGLQRVEDDADKVVEGDPADVLTPAADHAPEPRAERREHPGERPSLRREHDPDPQHYDADPLPRSRLGGRFPLPADLGEKSRAGRTLLGQHVRSPVAVIPDRGGAHECLRRAGEPREGVAEKARPVHAAAADGRLPRGVPPSGRDVLPREMDDGVEAPEPRRVDLPLLRVPSDNLLPRGGGRAGPAGRPHAPRRKERPPPGNRRVPWTRKRRRASSTPPCPTPCHGTAIAGGTASFRRFPRRKRQGRSGPRLHDLTGKGSSGGRRSRNSPRTRFPTRLRRRWLWSTSCVRKQRVVPGGAVLPDPPDPAAAEVPEEINPPQRGECRPAVHMAAGHGAPERVIVHEDREGKAGAVAADGPGG